MKNFISMQLGSLLVRRLLTILTIAIVFSVFFLFEINRNKSREIETTLSDALGYALQEPIRNWDLISITRTIESFHKANQTAKFCVSLNNETILSYDRGCQGALSHTYNVPLSDYKVKISVVIQQPFQITFILMSVGAMAFVLLVLMTKIKNTGAAILRDINNLGSSTNIKDFLYVETAMAQEKILVAEELIKEHENMKAKIELGRVATQVAHDIRGPLSSMQTALGFFGEMKVEDKKFNDVMNLLQLSSKRLSGIADGLLQKHKGTEEIPATFSLYRILDELAGEYHGQYHDVRFVKKYTSSPIELYGDAGKLQRAFGNIVKNAVEAMQYKGTITITTDIKTSSPSAQPSEQRHWRPMCRELCERPPTGGEGDYAVISISDTGPGMSSEKLGKVLRGGYTEGKKDGHGIGTQIVKQTVEEFKGKLNAESQEGQGTFFFITLPLPEQKSAVELTINSLAKEPIIIIDDDPSLREQWRLILREKEKQTLLCESYEDFQSQKIAPNISHTAIVDYHFDNSEKTGGDVLAILKRQGFTYLYLCTAEYWKPSVQKLTEDLNVTLCPKPLPRIEIKTMDHGPLTMDHEPRTKNQELKTKYTVLVIDDDPTIRMSWEMMQNKLGIASLHCYSNLEEMQSNGVDLQKVDIAFVDKNIEKSAFTGVDVLNHLKTQGIPKLVLASGENPKALRKDPQFFQADHIVQDKIPPSLAPFFV